MKILKKSIKIIRKNPKFVFMSFILFIFIAIFSFNINNLTNNNLFRCFNFLNKGIPILNLIYLTY